MAKRVYNFSMEENLSKIIVTEKKPSGLWEFLKAVIISILIVVPIRAYVAQPFIVDGASMEPNFHGGNYLIIDELSYQFFREPSRG
ncbi:MAG: S26 family signal peptidase, partial [Patescibacteria group bacterium]